MTFLQIRAPFQKLKVDSAEDLWSSFMDYMTHVAETPIVEPKIFNGKEGPQYGSLDKVRPLTLNGLCNYIGMSPGTWDRWKKEGLKSRQDEVDDKAAEHFIEVLLCIESVIYDHQFQGAAVDIFNASIISRKLGLADKHEHVSPDGTMSPNRQLTAEEIKQELEKRGLPIPDLT